MSSSATIWPSMIASSMSSAPIASRMFVNFFPRSFWFRDRTRVSVATTKHQGAVTVELDFVEPITGPHGIDQLRFHWLDKVGDRAQEPFCGSLETSVARGPIWRARSFGYWLSLTRALPLFAADGRLRLYRVKRFWEALQS